VLNRGVGRPLKGLSLSLCASAVGPLGWNTEPRGKCGVGQLVMTRPVPPVCVVASPGPPSPGSGRLDGPTSSDAQDYLSNASTTVKTANSFFAIHLPPATVELCRFKCRAASNADGSRGAVA